MIIKDLTQPLSKKLLIAMLAITVGSEIVLFLSRYSFLFSALYEAIMVSSFFIGWKLAPRLHGGKLQRLTKKQHILQFSKVYVVFYIGSMLINIFTSTVFQDFNNNYSHYVDTSKEIATFTYGGDANLSSEGDVSPVFQWFDTAGYDFYSNVLAGLEEVYRLSYMIIFLLILKKVFRRKWKTGPRDIFLMLALFISSFFFGAGHSLDTEQSWPVTIGSVITFTDMGLLLGLLLLWTKNLWLLVVVHALYDIITTVSWYYFDSADFVFAAVLFGVYIVLKILERIKTNKKMENETQEVSNF
ncbi:type II CAAX prenyl endopeptidase Rce1 family protein [Neobacillus terrae]|uniref:CPBP family glutamic-type intramembrane protease n=1 Tax=Neobacillus terrae TaxID=3034837 RepID=UPI00140C85F9|nr:CPBP family glutamic-type intramembrane protease [Neobacillus terrae]NHM30040.1 CPBP family intramembrane metalloprotease [Neobacillus terrae]